jgi:hypothetical protein
MSHCSKPLGHHFLFAFGLLPCYLPLGGTGLAAVED